MKLTVHELPLDRIRPAAGGEAASAAKRLLQQWRSCSHLLAVRPDGRTGRYVLLRGHNRYEYLTKQTNRKTAPCIVDDSGRLPSGPFGWLRRRRLFQTIQPHLEGERVTPAAWAVIRLFLKREPRFAKLSIWQKTRILLMAVRYRDTAVRAMRAAVERMSAGR